MSSSWTAVALASNLLLTGISSVDLREVAIEVPGAADFLAIDGDTVWVTNTGRVEHWSRTGKLGEVAMAHPCGAMTISGGSLWVADCKDMTVNRIDIKTARRTAVIATGLAGSDGEMNVVSGAGSVWVASDKKGLIARIDPKTNAVIASVKVESGSCYLAFGYDALWVVSAASRTVQKIDPVTNAAVKLTRLGKQPGFLAAGEGSVWVQEQGDGTVARLDPATAKVTGRVKIDNSLKYGDIDTGGGKLWLRTTANQTYVIIDPISLAVDARVGKNAGSGALRYTPTGIWTTAHDLHTLSWWPELTESRH